MCVPDNGQLALAAVTASKPELISVGYSDGRHGWIRGLPAPLEEKKRHPRHSGDVYQRGDRYQKIVSQVSMSRRLFSFQTLPERELLAVSGLDLELKPAFETGRKKWWRNERPI